MEAGKGGARSLKRHEAIVLVGGLCLMGWGAAMIYLDKLSLPLQFLVPVLPLYALMTFGCISLWSIGFSLLCFRDMPEAAAQLEQVRMEQLQL
jgi:hypothetical protein